MGKYHLGGLWWCISKLILSFRYRIKVKGLEELKLPKGGKGIIFLANHSAFIDPIIVQSIFWRRFRFYPIATEYLRTWFLIRYFLQQFNTLFIPNFDYSTNSYKRRKMEKMFAKIEDLVNQGENILIYPGGVLKNQAKEIVGANLSVYELLRRLPDAPIVLIRTTGLWGSAFSKALTGKAPKLIHVFLQGVAIVLKNLIFFTPKRDVLLECELAGPDFPRHGDRKELNLYLENWFNLRGSEPLKLISYSRWSVQLPLVYQRPKESGIDLGQIPEDIKERVIQEIADLAHVPQEQVSPEKDLGYDLGLDSLDRSQLVLILREQFGVQGVTTLEMTTVANVMAYAAKIKKVAEEEGEGEIAISHWFHIKHRPPAHYPAEAKTLLEAFLETERVFGYFVAATDPQIGEISYRRFKLGVILFAKYIQKLPGENVGIMLPASVAATMLIFATQLAGKTPVMINWTLGSNYLDQIVEQAKIEVVISAWRFLDRVDNVVFGKMDDFIQTMEEIRNKLSLGDLLSAKWLSFLAPAQLLCYFPSTVLDPDKVAVLLFTSGTESAPKGVPLTHRNIMENQKDALSFFQIEKTDVMLGFLPPFHSFGFSVTGVLPFVLGLRVAYSPNPTMGKMIAKEIYRWKATFLCSAPTFLKYLFRATSSEKLLSLRYLVSGAEAASGELIEQAKELCPGAEFLEGYGITECGPILTINRPQEEHKGVGKPLGNVELLLVHPESKEPVAAGEQGLILARGPNIFSGYLGKVASPFIEILGKRWYNTGDLGILDIEGRLTITGRLKRFVKMGGEMISLGALETALLRVAEKEGLVPPEMGTCLAVICLEKEGEKPELHLFTTLRAEKELFNKALSLEGVSNLIRLSSVHKVALIPLLGTGKVDYQKLKQEIK